MLTKKEHAHVNYETNYVGEDEELPHEHSMPWRTVEVPSSLNFAVVSAIWSVQLHPDPDTIRKVRGSHPTFDFNIRTACGSGRVLVSSTGIGSQDMELQEG